jgi:hypothetical protein
MIAFRGGALLILGVLLVACADSTGPGAADLRLVAVSFESLGRSRVEGGDGSGAGASRAAAQALRAGVRPARVRIAVDGVTEDYWALEVEHALSADLTQSPVLTLPIVARTMVAWRGAPAQRVISITVSSDTGTFSWARYETAEPPPLDRIYFNPAIGIMFERGGPIHFAVDGGARSTRQTIGAECPLPERPTLMQAFVPVLRPTACHRALFFTRFNMRVQEGPPAGAAAVRVRVVEMEGFEVPGIRLEYPLMYRPCPVCL